MPFYVLLVLHLSYGFALPLLSLFIASYSQSLESLLKVINYAIYGVICFMEDRRRNLFSCIYAILLLVVSMIDCTALVVRGSSVVFM